MFGNFAFRNFAWKISAWGVFDEDWDLASFALVGCAWKGSLDGHKTGMSSNGGRGYDG